jgi:hypothetical protein
MAKAAHKTLEGFGKRMQKHGVVEKHDREIRIKILPLLYDP